MYQALRLSKTAGWCHRCVQDYMKKEGTHLLPHGDCQGHPSAKHLNNAQNARE
jgi:hypothetical protein